MSKFSDWLLAEMEGRDFTQADIARKGGVSAPQISHILSGERQPGPKVVKAIARALEIPETEVLIQAGLMSRPPGYNPEVEELVSLIMTLPPDDREEILMLARQKIHRHRRGKPNAAKSSG